MIRERLIGVFLTLFFVNALSASDTLKINVRQADSIFLKNSYRLLAADLNVQAQKALELQAKLFPNPVLTAEVNVYDPQNDMVLHTGPTGEKVFQVEQLITIGGKRRAQIELARGTSELALLELTDLTRKLSYELHRNLFAVGQQEDLLAKYNTQLELLDNILTAYQDQVSRGNIPLRDLVRLKGAYLEVNNDRAALLRDYFEAQTNLRKILQVNATISFVFTEKDIGAYVKTESLDNLRNIALANRSDLQIARKQADLARLNYRFERRQAIPDLSLYAAYDQRGGAFINQYNAGISMPLPVFNRNQGNVRSSALRVRESDFLVKSTENDALAEVQNAFSFYTQTSNEYQKATRLYNEDFEVTIRGMNENFMKRNVSLIEYIDFLESYNLTLTELVRIKTQLVSSAEEINMLVGQKIY